MKELQASLNVMRRLPPDQQRENLQGLLQLVPPHVQEELVQRVDVPLEAQAKDPETGQGYLLCDYNSAGGGDGSGDGGGGVRYRSPWSNKYYPAAAASKGGKEDADLYYPSDQLRTLEIEANDLFDVYRELYYGGQGVSSVYLWELDHHHEHCGFAFAGCVAIKKTVTETHGLEKGCWDSFHIIEVLPTSDGKSGTYKLSSTCTLSLAVDHPEAGHATVGGTLTRRTEAIHPLQVAGGGHIANLGKMIEDMESQLQGDLDALYIQRTGEIVGHHVRMRKNLNKSGNGGGEGEEQEEEEGNEKKGKVAAIASKMGGMNLHQQSLFAAISKHANRKEKEEVSEG